METFEQTAECPRCGHRTMRSWNELTDEERMLVRRLPASAEFTEAERKKHRFCRRCWFEEVSRQAFA
ncbi:MAG: hypothetical protein IT173_18495 [Acidobacteria bacterium]|nr:hypothetical protein [Acidobacteriota bacterium]